MERTKHSPPWFKPFLKRILSRPSNLLEVFESIARENDIVRLPVIRPNYLVNDPEAIYHILLTNKENYTKAGTSYERIENAVGKGLLTTSGEEWAKRRKEYQPLFQTSHIKLYTNTVQKYTRLMLAQWEKQAGHNLDMTEEMLSLVMNISADAFLGLDVSDRSIEMVRLIHTLNDFAVHSISLWKWLPTFKNVRYQLAKRTIDHFLLTSLKASSFSESEPLLQSLLLKNNEGEFLLPEDQILGEIKSFFFAGHETTGNALTWTLYCLAKHPYVLHQVLEEINRNLDKKDPNFDDLDSLSYLDMVIQESFRLYPPIWIFTRKAINEDKLLDYDIPAGAIVNIVPYLIHRHPKYWNQPTVFYPERFLEGQPTRPKCAYIPFGFGPRVCIGRQFAMVSLKLILTMILQRFTLELPHKLYEVKASPFITLKAEKNIKLKIRKIR